MYIVDGSFYVKNGNSFGFCRLTEIPESVKIQTTAIIYQIGCISTGRFLQKIKSTGFRSKPKYPKMKKRSECAFIVVIKTIICGIFCAGRRKWRSSRLIIIGKLCLKYKIS